MTDEELTMEIAADLRARVVALEQWRQEMNVLNARRDEQWKNMLERFEAMGAKIDGVSLTMAADLNKVDIKLSGDLNQVNDNIRWLTRLIIGAMVTGIIGGSITLLFTLAK